MNSHPTDTDLVAVLDGEPDERVAAHVATCATCRTRLAAAGAPVRTPTPRALPDLEVPAVAEERTNTPSAGDIWRVAWEDVRQLALVRAATADVVSVVPLVLELPQLADEWTLLLPAGASTLGIELGSAVAHTYALPRYVFDSKVGAVDQGILAVVEDARLAYRTGSVLDVAAGTPIAGPLDPRIEAIGEMIDEFVELAEASWVGEHQDADPVDWLALAGPLNLAPQRLLDLSRGARPTEAEMQAAAAVGVELRPAPEPGLVAAMDTPVISARVRRLAARTEEPEADTRLDTAWAVANGQFALAARGQYGATDWLALLEAYLDERGV